MDKNFRLLTLISIFLLNFLLGFSPAQAYFMNVLPDESIVFNVTQNGTLPLTQYRMISTDTDVNKYTAIFIGAQNYLECHKSGMAQGEDLNNAKLMVNVTDSQLQVGQYIENIQIIGYITTYTPLFDVQGNPVLDAKGAQVMVEDIIPAVQKILPIIINIYPPINPDKTSVNFDVIINSGSSDIKLGPDPAYDIININDALGGNYTINPLFPWLTAEKDQNNDLKISITPGEKINYQDLVAVTINSGTTLSEITVKVNAQEELQVIPSSVFKAIEGKYKEVKDMENYITCNKPIHSFKVLNNEEWVQLKYFGASNSSLAVRIDPDKIPNKSAPNTYCATVQLQTEADGDMLNEIVNVDIVFMLEQPLNSIPGMIKFSTTQYAAPPAEQIIFVNKPVDFITNEKNFPAWLTVKKSGQYLLVKADQTNWEQGNYSTTIDILTAAEKGYLTEEMQIPVSLTINPPTDNNTPPPPVPFTINKDNITFNVTKGGDAPAYEAIWANKAYDLPADCPNWLIINQINFENAPCPMLAISVNMNLLPETPEDFYSLWLTSSDNEEQKSILINLKINGPENADQEDIIDSSLANVDQRAEDDAAGERDGDRKAPDNQTNLLLEQLIALPEIQSIDPAAAPAGTGISIKGSNFDDLQGSNYVYFGNISNKASIVSWSSQEIKAIIPYISAGSYDVKVVKVPDASDLSKIQESNTVAFAITVIAGPGEAVIYPNPYNPNSGNVNIVYENVNANLIEVHIYDTTARKVYQTSATTSFVTWNGYNLSNNIVGDGVYLARVIDATSKKTLAKGKILVVRQ